MNRIALIPTFKETNGGCNGEPVEKEYTMEGVKIVGQVSPYAVAPLRILSYILKAKDMYCREEIYNINPWEIKKLIIDNNDAEFVKMALEEIMEYRCADELGSGFEAIIRQLPFNVAMRTSEELIPFIVTEEEKKSYTELLNNKDYIFHVPPLVEMSEEQRVLRKHLIYRSARGGYNIKTKGYDPKRLEHYCYIDSNSWD